MTGILLNMLLSLNSINILLRAIANSMDPDQARQNVWPSLDPNCLTLLCIPERIFDFAKKLTDDEKARKIT